MHNDYNTLQLRIQRALNLSKDAASLQSWCIKSVSTWHQWWTASCPFCRGIRGALRCGWQAAHWAGQWQADTTCRMVPYSSSQKLPVLDARYMPLSLLALPTCSNYRNTRGVLNTTVVKGYFMLYLLWECGWKIVFFSNRTHAFGGGWGWDFLPISVVMVWSVCTDLSSSELSIFSYDETGGEKARLLRRNLVTDYVNWVWNNYCCCSKLMAEGTNCYVAYLQGTPSEWDYVICLTEPLKMRSWKVSQTCLTVCIHARTLPTVILSYHSQKHTIAKSSRTTPIWLLFTVACGKQS